MGHKKKDLLFRYLLLLILSYLVTTLLLLILAAFVYGMRLSEETVSIVIIGIYIVVTFGTGYFFGHQMERKKYLWGALIGIGYFAILWFISILVSGNIQMEFRSCMTTFILCAGSGMLGGMVAK